MEYHNTRPSFTEDELRARYDAMKERCDVLTGQRDRLRIYAAFMEDEDWPANSITQNRDYYLQPGDMTAP